MALPAVRRYLPDLSPLQYRDYRLVYFGEGIASAGAMVTYVAIPFQVFDLTGSTLLVGLIGVAQLIPLLFLAVLGGVLADTLDRRRQVILAEVGLVLVVLGLLGNALLPEPSVAAIFVLAGIASGLNGIRRPPLEALLQVMVPREKQPASAALRGLSGTLAQVGGPALGGILIAAVGLPLTFGVNVATYLVALVALLLVRTYALPGAGGSGVSFQAIVDGFRFAKSRQELMGSYVVDFAAMVFGMPFALFPAIADSLAASSGLEAPQILGFLYAAPGAGAFLASLTAGWTRHVHRHGVGIAVAAAGWGVAVLVFGFVESVPLALVMLAFAGGADMISGVFRLTLWNQTIPVGMRGRLAAIEQVSYASGPYLGNARAGMVAAVGGVPFAVVSGGVLCLVGIAASCLWLPKFWQYDARTAPDPDAPEGVDTPVSPGQDA